LCHLANTLKT